MEVVEKLHLDPFMSPYQHTPPASKVISALVSPDLDSKHSKPLSSLNHVEGPNEPRRPFLINVGKLNGIRIVRGGFNMKKEAQEYAAFGMKCYPPPPNAAYALTSQAYPPKDPAITDNFLTPLTTADRLDKQVDTKNITGWQRSLLLDEDKTSVKDLQGLRGWDGPAHEDFGIEQTLVDCIKPLPLSRERYDPLMQLAEKQSCPKSATPIRNQTKGEILADSIDFEREAWIIWTPGVSGELYSSEEQRMSVLVFPEFSLLFAIFNLMGTQDDFIRHIENETLKLDNCKKCKIAHILPGPPITLEDRDTCGSYLPDWFPAEDYEKPWKQFRKMINDMVYLTELTQGFSHKPNPDAPVWDLNYHDYDKKWRMLGRRGGWWKCRADEAAAKVEKDCELCHDPLEDAKIKETKKAPSVAERLNIIHDFIRYHTKRAGEEDKAVCLVRTRSEVEHGSPSLSSDASRSTLSHGVHSVDAT